MAKSSDKNYLKNILDVSQNISEDALSTLPPSSNDLASI